MSAPEPRDVAPRAALLSTAAALLACLLLVAALFGLLPSREPEVLPSTRFDAEGAVERARLPAESAGAPPANRAELWSFPLCPAPPEGARMYRLDGVGERDLFAVWCDAAFILVEVRLREGLPEVARTGVFPARGALPGGAVALDLDRDGVRDLALAVAPPQGVVHRAFSGVFWLRGRAGGGYEPARALVETPVVGLAAADLDGQPGEELVALTRGDLAAQRPGELFVFAGGSTPSRVAVLPGALAPVDLGVGGEGPSRSELFILSQKPGSVVRVRLPRAGAFAEAERSEVRQRGLLGFVAGPRGASRLVARDSLGVHVVHPEPLRLAPLPASIRVGPAAWLEGEGSRPPPLIGASERGFVWIDARGIAREHALPAGVRVVDAGSIGAGASTPRAVLLVTTAEEPARLALVVLPERLRGETSEVALRSGQVELPDGAPQVVLE